MWKENYIYDYDGVFNRSNKLYADKNVNELREYVIMFNIRDIRFCCNIYAKNTYEALGIFFVNHEDLTYDNISVIIEQCDV